MQLIFNFITFIILSKLPSIDFVWPSNFKSFKTSTWVFPWFSIAFVYFSKAFPKGTRVNLACSIICFWLEGNISTPARYS